MTDLSLKQFVPSEVCLKCKGCCRYKSADSVWRPKLGPSDQESLSSLINAGGVLDPQAYVTTVQSCAEHLCRFLNTGDNTCGIYTNRPFECSLYPFILSFSGDFVKVYVHLSCPYVQDYLSRPYYEAHIAYLREFFRRSDVREFLSRNKSMLHDYSNFAAELLYLFDLAFL